jgi:hypothetical protein
MRCSAWHILRQKSRSRTLPDRKSKGKLNEYGLVSLLEDTFAQNASNKENEATQKKLLELIQKQKEKDPYYGLRFEQKIIIQNLENALGAADSNARSSGLIDQIKEVVRRQNFEIDELRKSTTWGLPIGIAGIVATVIFGIVGLSYPLIRRRSG